MDLFVRGMSRSQLKQPVLMQLAIWRFMPCVETTIEEKHARVTIAKKAHNIGATRVSNSNRLPLLQRLLLRGHVAAKDLLECFSVARSLPRAVKALGLSEHPELQEKMKPAKLQPVLRSVLYRTDLVSMYHDTTAAGKTHMKRKRAAQTRRDALANKKRGPRVGDMEELERNLMMQHFRSISSPTVVYTMPSGLLQAPTVIF